MVLLNAKLSVGPNAPFGSKVAARPISARIAEFEAGADAAAKSAARVATTATRNGFTYKRPPQGAQRNKRSSTGGRFADFLQWKVDENGQVAFDLDRAKAAPHWIIMELGTASRGRMRFAGDSDRGVDSSVTMRTVRAQKGRRIHPAFVFATGPGGQYSAPGEATGQQLFARNKVTGAPRQRLGIKIKREIEAQHFVKKGAETGFLHYRESVLAAARQAFQKGSGS